MSDYIISAPNKTTLYQTLAIVGFWDSANQIPLVTGSVQDGIQWMLKIAGVFYQQTGDTTTDTFGNVQYVTLAVPGYWCRVRILSGLGTDPFQTTPPPTLPANVLCYQYITPDGQSASVWTPDGGITVGPDYINSIGAF